MPLSTAITSFAKELHRLETPFPKTPEEATRRFATAYLNFLKNAMAGPVPINPAPLADPAKKEILINNLLIAFRAKTGSAFSLALEKAIKLYLNTQTAAVLFTSATSFLFTVPLYPLLKTLILTKAGYPAKLKFAQKLYDWKTKNQIIFPNPPGGIGPQFWV